MSQIPSLGRPRVHSSTRIPPLVAITPTPPPPSDHEPGADLFDPNRTPPPPAAPIFRGGVPEEKQFGVTPQRRWSTQGLQSGFGGQLRTDPARRVPTGTQRPLTGRPPAPPLHRGVRLPPAPRARSGVSQTQTSLPTRKAGPAQPAASAQQAVSSQVAAKNYLEVIQTTLLSIQSYLDTLAAVSSQQTGQTPQPPPTLPPRNPRAPPNPSSSPATLADLMLSPQPSRKR